MNCLFSLIVFTSNILGSFNDPFEFDGNYGKEVNPIRDYVFEQVVSKEALKCNLTDQLIAQAIQEDLQHGPTLNELLPPSLIEQLINKQQELQEEGFSKEDLDPILQFISRYGEQKVFAFFRHSPKELLSLDKKLRDQATREGKPLDLPILSSTQPLEGSNAFELKASLLQSIFTQKALHLTQSVQADKLKTSLQQLDPLFLKRYLGPDAHTEDLLSFATPAGQICFYWIYQSLNLHLIAQDETMIPQINRVKHIFLETLGNPHVRAQMFRDQFIAHRASVVFTQESDSIVPQLLAKEGEFYSTASQNPADGTFVFLRADVWEPIFQTLAVEDYDGYTKGRLNLLLATTKETQEKFLLASCHGNSTRSEDGRLQITKVVETFHRLAALPENQGLQLIIGIDANTKSHQDIKLLRKHLKSLRLVGTSVGPTTVKKRMVTAQEEKAGRSAIDEEDYILLLNRKSGGRYRITRPTIGFRNQKPDQAISLPNMDNPSDHYPVGVTLLRSS